MLTVSKYPCDHKRTTLNPISQCSSYLLTCSCKNPDFRTKKLPAEYTSSERMNISGGKTRLKHRAHCAVVHITRAGLIKPFEAWPPPLDPAHWISTSGAHCCMRAPTPARWLASLPQTFQPGEFNEELSFSSLSPLIPSSVQRSAALIAIQGEFGVALLASTDPFHLCKLRSSRTAGGQAEVKSCSD